MGSSPPGQLARAGRRRATGRARPVIPGGLNTLVLCLVVGCLVHAADTVGARRTVAFVAITLTTSWVAEQVGVGTGLVYGPYIYTAALGPELGSVPLIIPLAWFAVLYPSYVAANLLLHGRFAGTPGTRAHLVRLALLGAVMATAGDLLIDPILSGPTVRAWVWEQSGTDSGVPIHNALGWVGTAFVVIVLYRLLERRWAPRRLVSGSRRQRGRPGRDRSSGAARRCSPAALRSRWSPPSGDCQATPKPRPPATPGYRRRSASTLAVSIARSRSRARARRARLRTPMFRRPRSTLRSLAWAPRLWQVRDAGSR